MRKYIQKNFNVLLIFLVLSVFLVSGQQGCPGGGDKEIESAVNGLEISFINEAPPLSVSVNQGFPIYLDILNKGGDFINQGDAKFYLSGVGPNLEGVSPVQTNARSLPKESVSPDRAVFAERAKFTFPIERLHTLPLSLTSCYKYGTRTEASICVSASNESSVCTVGAERIGSGSNSVAPVQITSLREDVTGDILRVFFTLENKMGGIVYLQDTDCDKLQAKDISESFKQDKVSIEVRSLESGFNCKLLSSSSPYIPVDSLQGTASLGTVVCEKTLSGRENYKAPFSIVTRYKYVDSTLKSINIVP